MSLDWWPSIHGLWSVNPVWGHHVCNGRDLHGSAGLGPEKGRGQAKRAIAVPPGAATDRLGTSGQIWEGNVDGGAWEGPAAREQPCSRAASQNSLLTANLQTREKPGCGTDFSLWPPAIAVQNSHDFSILVFFGRLRVKKIIWNFHMDWRSWGRDYLFLCHSLVYFGRVSRPIDAGAHGGNPVQYLTLLDPVCSQTCK